MAPEDLTLNDACIRYIGEVSRGQHKYNMKVLLKAFGRGTLLSQLDDARVNGAVQWLRTRPATKGRPAKLSPATVNRYLTTLHVVCRRARELWGVQVGAWNKARHMQEEPDGREVFLEQDQARALVAAAVGHLRPILLLDLMTGLRRDNVVQLTWEQVSLDLARIVLVQKGGRRHAVALPPAAVQLLDGLQPDPLGRKGPAFRFGNPNVPCACPRCAHKQQRYAGQPIRSIKRAFATAAKAAGLDALPSGRMRFHDLRHTFASWLLAACGDLRIVQDALGHRVLTTTARYAHLMPGRKEAAIAAATAHLAAPTLSADADSTPSGHKSVTQEASATPSKCRKASI